MKKSFLLASLLFSFFILFAQNELVVQNSSKGLYLNHIVSPRQNFYSIGRLFNVSPKEIAAYNSLDMSKGLAIGQTIMIPLNAKNFSQAKNIGVPIYYITGENETLFKVSNKNNKVLMSSLRKWNKLGSENIAPGEKLIVGYLISPEANKIVVASPIAINQAPQQIEPPLKEDTKKDIADQKKETIEKRENVIVPKETLDRKPQTLSPKTVSSQTAVMDVNGGYFKSQFDQRIKAQPLKAEMTATSGIFKTASGWQDAKYYVLVDNIEPGTIIRIVNPTNNKIIYAKVLGTMSGVRQNQGYDVRISNAAASALNVSDSDKFILRVFY